LQALGYFTSGDFAADGTTLKSGIATPTIGPGRAGGIRYQDQNGDGKIDSNDQVVIGRPRTPQLIYGLAPRLTFKNFDVDVLAQGAALTSFYMTGPIVWPFDASSSATELAFQEKRWFDVRRWQIAAGTNGVLNTPSYGMLINAAGTSYTKVKALKTSVLASRT
jgi:hypothetical protein